MTVFFLLTCIFILMTASFFLSLLLLKTPLLHDSWSILCRGMREGLHASGFKVSGHPYPVELWVWKTVGDDQVCDNCLERASWPPMDIADWMKEGLPRTPECETECSENCRCQLIPYRPRKSSRTLNS